MKSLLSLIRKNLNVQHSAVMSISLQFPATLQRSADISTGLIFALYIDEYTIKRDVNGI